MRPLPPSYLMVFLAVACRQPATSAGANGAEAGRDSAAGEDSGDVSDDPEDAAPGDVAETARDAGRPQSDRAAVVSFVREVWPVLVRECIRCHDHEFRGDFRQPEGAYAALTNPRRQVGHICNANETPILPVIVPGDPERSGLWRLIGVGYHRCAEVYGMPKFDPRGILRAFDSGAAETIRRWIAAGAAND